MLRFLCQFALLLCDKLDDDLVDERSVGFHDVVGERERVVVVAVENSEIMAMSSMARKCSCSGLSL